MEAYNIIPEWNELVFRNLTPEEKEEYSNFDWSYMIENLPEYNEDVLVTDGSDVWVDAFDEDISGEIYLSATCCNVDEVTAWMPLPTPYKGE
jgi:hypothetical protein